MNPDRATLNFLNRFNEEAKKEGQRLHDEGAVVQIFGNHLFIQGRVDDGVTSCRTNLKLQGNEWEGSCSCWQSTQCPSVYATMVERLARGADLPEAPNEVGEKSFAEILEEDLGRQLAKDEEDFVSKLERRYRRYELERSIFDSDLVRLNPRWPVNSYDPLNLWPTPPANIVEFWNFVAYAFRKQNLNYPEFLEGVTDLDWAENQLSSWQRDLHVSEWRHTVERYEGKLPGRGVEPVEFRLMVAGREVRLLAKGGEDEQFHRVTDKADFDRLKQLHLHGALRTDGASEVIWAAILEASGESGEPAFKLDEPENCRLLNRLFHQPQLKDRIVNLDEHPFRRAADPLKWICRESEASSSDYELQLCMADGLEVPHVLRLLPGEENLYLSDETVLSGPNAWRDDNEMEPRYEIPQGVIESEAGIAFCRHIGAEIPESLEKKIKDRVLKVSLEMTLSSGVTSGGSEHMLVKVVAQDAEGARVEELHRDIWEVKKRPEPKNGELFRYDRSILQRVPACLERMGLIYDANAEQFRTRITRNFPEKYLEWTDSLPEEFEIVADEELKTLRAEPVEASVTFEIVDQEIDWFDLKVVVNVEGYDLSQEEIRALVAARGGFVRMNRGGWLRLHMNLNDVQKEAVSRIGLDPFDLTGEVHRMHVLQLAEPLAKEVFDTAAWDRISTRSGSLKLQVSPSVPDGLSVTLRPYQVEGFSFLSYLSANRFGGILADDMGLGKTIQSLTWLLWLRTKVGDNPPPCLVVCPKSVLDVWAGEVRKAAPGLNVQVLRNRADLDVAEVLEKVDVLVINYSQLRGSAEDLIEVEWLAVILDEGQQIKNPDSKAAKAARQLRAKNRLVLTGTPIENRLLDVWSLMAFAMPGILGNRKYFRERFDRRKDPQSQTRLTARLRPFLLRRTKGEVDIDLPPKTEEDVFCKMEETQERLYQEELERIQKILLGLESDESLRKNSFVILQGLMRLRQICCHPGLLNPAHAAEESAKMSALFYLLNQLHEEGHKVLVFSQFVTMLDLIKDRLEDEGRPYSYLTGKTADRREVIEDFQNTKDPNVFLLSLKAGGSGLNLTAASYVVLYDPWWNPAVENQAIDRTHRIGQQSKVMAYRLLVRDSVEEKIRVLQQQKQSMMKGVLGEEGFARNLQREDLEFLFGRENEQMALA